MKMERVRKKQKGQKRRRRAGWDVGQRAQVATGARGAATYLFLSWRQTGEKGGKKIVVYATVPGKKTKKG